MTVATRKRQRRIRKRTDPKPGKESWLIIGPDGVTIRETVYGEGATLSLAQNLMKTYTDEVEITVQWKALFGEPDTLYRIARTEGGDVLTYAL